MKRENSQKGGFAGGKLAGCRLRKGEWGKDLAWKMLVFAHGKPDNGATPLWWLGGLRGLAGEYRDDV